MHVRETEAFTPFQYLARIPSLYSSHQYYVSKWSVYIKKNCFRSKSICFKKISGNVLLKTIRKIVEEKRYLIREFVKQTYLYWKQVEVISLNWKFKEIYFKEIQTNRLNTRMTCRDADFSQCYDLTSFLWLPSSSSSSRCCRGCWDSSSSPPSAQQCCYQTVPPWSPAKRTAPPWTPTPTTGMAQRGLQRNRLSHQRESPPGYPSPATAPCRCHLQDNRGYQVATWLTAPTSSGCSGALTQQCPPCLIQRSVTCCWTHRYRHLSTRFLFSVSAHTVRAPWGPKETVETGALQVCKAL